MFGDEKYCTIKNLSERRRLPLLGKIRLGIKVKNKNKSTRCSCKDFESCVYCSHPTETDYFVCPPEVIAKYSQEPKELDVMLPVEQITAVFPQAYRYYGSSRGLKCIGNGETAKRFSDDKKSIEEIECPCDLLDQKKCNKRAFLMAILPRVSLGGVYQISTGGYHSIVELNSSIEYVQAMIGRIAMVPLILKREPITTHFEGKSQEHYMLKLHLPTWFNVDNLNDLRRNTQKVIMDAASVALPAPKDENPEYDPADVIESMGITEEKPDIPEKTQETPQKPVEPEEPADTPEQPKEAPGAKQDKKNKGSGGLCPVCHAPDGKPHASNCSFTCKDGEPDAETTPVKGNDDKQQRIAKFIKDIDMGRARHLSVVWKAICGYMAKAGKDSPANQMRLVKYYDSEVHGWGDLKRCQLEEILYDIAQAKGDIDAVCIDF